MKDNIMHKRLEGVYAEISNHRVKCMTLVTLLFLLTFCTVRVLNCEKVDPTPVILVPGFGSSQAFALPKSSSESFLVWLNLIYLVDVSDLDFFFSLDFDPETNQTRDKPHADIYFPGWGSTETIENLDTSPHMDTSYFASLVDYLTLDKYFVRNKTLRGTPYDFRKAPYESTKMLINLQNLIEETVEATQSKVAILAHSMGVMYSLRFFELMTDEWKANHIKMFIATSGPYGGLVKNMKAEASGSYPQEHIFGSLRFRGIERSFPSTAFLLPNPKIFPPNEPIIITPEKNYSSADYKDFFKDINYENAYKFYELSHDFPMLQEPTGIDEIHCIYGTEVDTMRQAVYAPPTIIRGKFPDQSPVAVFGDGDGSVNIESLKVCNQWPNTKVVELPNGHHTQILKDGRYLNLVSTLLGSQSISLSIRRWIKQFINSFTQKEEMILS